MEAIDTTFGYFKAVSLPEDYRKEFVSKITAETVHASTAIEGNTLTEKQVIVSDYLPPQYSIVPTLIKEFVQWINNHQPPHLSPILYTGIGHYQFVAIHPFEDGNGRTTRILTTLMLIKYGYYMTSFFALESYYNRNRKAYYEALNSADKYRVE